MDLSFLQAAVTKEYPGAGMVMLIGMVVVFSVLLFLTFVFWLFGVIGSSKKESSPAVATPAPMKAPAAKPPVPVASAADDEEEIVAAITAAIASMETGDTHYIVRRIRPASSAGSRPA